MLSLELKYFLLFSGILLLPKMLLRFGIPSALTAMILGLLTSSFLGWFENDQLLLMLSRLGITSLFLFAGMEVDVDELKEDSSVLIKHLVNATSLLILASIALIFVFDLSFKIALILSLGLMTPSTGFILNSLRGYELTKSQERWVRSKAISKELVAILILFFALQSESIEKFAISTLVLVAMIALLPWIFKFFLKVVAPFAPDSEVSFLILLALLCGVITTELGTYYLVGAFIVGMIAARFEHFMNHRKSQEMLYALSLFFSFFVPFYFYRAGLDFPVETITSGGLVTGLVFMMVFLPLRILSVQSSLWFFARDSWKDRVAIAMPLLPTLIFGLVISTILRENLNAPPSIVTGLLIYTIGASILPWFFLKKIPAEPYDTSMLR